MNDTVIKACPFCGSAEARVQPDKFCVSCPACGATGPDFCTSDSEAVARWSKRAGDREPDAPKTTYESTLASANGSATPQEWWAKKASELAHQMKQGGVGELRLLRLPTGKYEFEITPEGWPNLKVSRDA